MAARLFLADMLAFLLLILPLVSAHIEHSLLLVISFDGFRHDYIEMTKQAGKSLPNFDKIIKNGIQAEYLQNSFVTKTFPNHYTLATGMYEEHHGVLSNVMYDPVYNETIAMYNADQDSKWWNGTTDRANGPEPIWITNQNKKSPVLTHRTGVFFWPGSSAPFYGQLPHHHQLYNASVPYRTRVDQMVDWFTSESEPINLGMLYIEEPDSIGHKVGPNDPAVLDKIVELDDLIGYLYSRLDSHHLADHVNIIFTSDHGMVDVTDTQVIQLDDHVDISYFTSYGVSPVYTLRPIEGKEDVVFNSLSNVPHLNVYHKTDIPAEYHYSNSRRIFSITVVADEGWTIKVNSSDGTKMWKKGDHGYSNSLPSMRPFFLATGPAFVSGLQTRPLQNVDVYSLICEILVLDPHPNDGQLERIKHILTAYAHVSSQLSSLLADQTMVTYLLVFLFCALISSVCSIAACRSTSYSVYKRRHPLAIPMDAMLDATRMDKVHLLSAIESDEDDDIFP